MGRRAIAAADNDVWRGFGHPIRYAHSEPAPGATRACAQRHRRDVADCAREAAHRAVHRCGFRGPCSPPHTRWRARAIPTPRDPADCYTVVRPPGGSQATEYIAVAESRWRQRLAGRSLGVRRWPRAGGRGTMWSPRS
ncbi:hypothetical protein GCM10010502_56720 [Kitasatospora aureofaciens]|uniref:Uncharacterized protein n=1 Tax=Kitasatospora aureofaciens TaxID=1894 RepID=A0A8H9LUN0_KITAU|nr:hypothetical protein GCM10010502_56720 [Kitasatospora aureofaciens]